MKSHVILLSVLYFVGVHCSESKTKRDVSELLQKSQNLFAKPNFNYQPGYDYPRPGQSQGPFFREPEPTYIETKPIYREVEEPSWVQTRPVQPTWVQTRPVEPSWVQTRPVEPSWVQTRPQPIDPSYIVRPIYQQPRPTYGPPQNIEPLNQVSEKLFWPLIEKVANAFNPNYFPGGTNTIGFPGNPMGPSYPGNPGTLPSYPNKFSWLGNLFPGFRPNYNNNFQRIAYYPSPKPVITSTSNTGFVQNPVVIPSNPDVVQKPAVYPVYEQGVNSIGDSVVVDSANSAGGYYYPKPTEQLPPLDLPNSIQFRAEPKKDQDINK